MNTPRSVQSLLTQVLTHEASVNPHGAISLITKLSGGGLLPQQMYNTDRLRVLISTFARSDDALRAYLEVCAISLTAACVIEYGPGNGDEWTKPITEVYDVASKNGWNKTDTVFKLDPPATALMKECPHLMVALLARLYLFHLVSILNVAQGVLNANEQLNPSNHNVTRA